jgi:hypothetical protein
MERLCASARASLRVGLVGASEGYVRTYLASAETTSFVKSGGFAPDADAALLFHSGMTTWAMCVNMPLALQRSLTAKVSFSSLARRSASGRARSRSYVPREAMDAAERLDRA